MNKLLTPEEVAELLQVKKGTIYQWSHMGFIPHVKLGSRLRFRLADIEAWVGKKSVKGRATRRVNIDEILEPRQPRLPKLKP